MKVRYFPGGPWLKHHLLMQGVWSLVRELGSHMSRGQKNKTKQNIKQKQYCNKFNKDFKHDPHQIPRNLKKNENEIHWGKCECYFFLFSLHFNSLNVFCVCVGWLPRWPRDESSSQCGRTGSIPGLGRPPWRRKWQSTPAFLPGESPWTEELGGLQPMGSDMCLTLLRPHGLKHTSLSFTISQSLLKLISFESVTPFNHLVLCCPLLLPSIFPSIRVFSNE